MKFTSRTVRCNEPGLTQEQALASLYSHYGDDIRVTSVKRRGDAWVVNVQQRIAEFPPKKDEGGPEAPEPAEAPVDDEGGDETDAPPAPDGPPSDGDDEGEGKKKDPQAEILHLLHEIAGALGVGGGLHDKIPAEGGDMPLPPPPGPDAGPDAGLDGPEDGPEGGPDGLPPMAKKPTKLKPGEVLPGQTPIGSPAFASTHAATITVESGQVNPQKYSASMAQTELEANFPGYGVKQMYFDRTASVYRALLSIH